MQPYLLKISRLYIKIILLHNLLSHVIDIKLNIVWYTANKMPLQFKNSEGQVFLGCLGGINYCLFLYCDITINQTKRNLLLTFYLHFQFRSCANFSRSQKLSVLGIIILARPDEHPTVLLPRTLTSESAFHANKQNKTKNAWVLYILSRFYFYCFSNSMINEW